jgi:hypothetical protein
MLEFGNVANHLITLLSRWTISVGKRQSRIIGENVIPGKTKYPLNTIFLNMKGVITANADNDALHNCLVCLYFKELKMNGIATKIIGTVLSFTVRQ